MHSSIDLKRDVDAIQIPSGETVKLPIGTKVIITQSLGGTYTVATDFGLARIQSKDIDALGIDPAAEEKKNEPSSSSNIPDSASDLEQEVWAQLKNVFDPEIPVNIVDLGLVYDCRVVDTPEGKKRAEVKMTLTAPGCGMGPVIAEDARQKISALPTVESAKVHVVWDPIWGPQMISAEGRKILGLE